MQMKVFWERGDSPDESIQLIHQNCPLPQKKLKQNAHLDLGGNYAEGCLSMGGEQADGEAGFWWKLTSSEETGWFTRGGKHFFSQQGGTGNKGTGRYIHKGVTKEPDYHTQEADELAETRSRSWSFHTVADEVDGAQVARLKNSYIS